MPCCGSPRVGTRWSARGAPSPTSSSSTPSCPTWPASSCAACCAPIRGSRAAHRCCSPSARLSDVVGRLSPTEFAVLAPGTDAAGARRLAERLASTVQASAGGMPTPAADPGAQPLAQLRVRCGYEAVANVGYAPIEPVDLLVRASTALRTGRAEGGSWLRRFDDGASTTPTP